MYLFSDNLINDAPECWDINGTGYSSQLKVNLRPGQEVDLNSSYERDFADKWLQHNPNHSSQAEVIDSGSHRAHLEHNRLG